MERCQPFADGDVIYGRESGFYSLPCFGMGGREVIVKLLEVALVIAQGVLAQVALVAQMLEKLG